MISQSAKGYLCAMISGISFGMNGLFTLPLYERGMSVPMVLLCRFSLGSILIACIMAATGKSFRISGKQLLHAAGLGILFSMTSFLFFLGLSKMDAGLVTTAGFIYPAIVALIMFLFFRERLGLVSWGALLISLLGVALLYEGNGSFSAAGLTYAMLSALSYALFIVGLKFSPLQQLSSESLTFYQMLLSLPCFLIMTLCDSNMQLPHDMIGWGCISGLAVFPACCSILFMSLALRYVGPTKTSILTAIEPLTAIFFGVLLFDETLTLKQIIGVAVILFSVTLVVAGKNLSFSRPKIENQKKN